jgi:hypothetical protein
LLAVLTITSVIAGTVAFSGATAAAPGDVVYRANAAGGTVPSADGGPDWVGDEQYLVAGGDQTSSWDQPSQIDPSVPDSTPDGIWNDERYDPQSGDEMQYEFDVPDGQAVEVRLYFYDGYDGTSEPGDRVFDVSVEDQTIENFDPIEEYGDDTGGMESFTVTSDGTIDVDFDHVTENPQINAIEIVESEPEPDTLGGPSEVDFGTVVAGDSGTETITVTNLGGDGDPSIDIDDVSVSGGDADEFSAGSASQTTLAPGESADIPVTFAPSDAESKSAALEVSHTGANSPLSVDLSGEGSSSVPVDFGHTELEGFSEGNPTSIDWGPDGRLYVSTQNGEVFALTVERNGEDDYGVTDTETIDEVLDIPNHNDDGSFGGPDNKRQVTGLRVGGTADQPVLYVTSSDPRISVGNDNAPEESLDTNSGTLSRLTQQSDGSWSHEILVRGLPRSEENHATNGIAVADGGDTIYIAQGGHTNQGAPGDKLSYLPEYALSAAILEIDVAQIENNYQAKSALDENGNAYAEYYYDIPTLNPEQSNAPNGGPFGGLDGQNMGKLVENGPVQVYSPGYRNPYDVVKRPNGDLYTVDNGHNGGWGDQPVNEGTAQCTNEINDGGGGGANPLHHIDQEGYYGGHANPTRANPDGANVYAGGFQNNAGELLVDFSENSPVEVPANEVECDWQAPGNDGALTTFGASTNGLGVYTADNFGGALEGALLAASFDGNTYYTTFNGDGTQVEEVEPQFSTGLSTPLDVTAMGDQEAYPGTVWVADFGGNDIDVYEPDDYGTNTEPPQDTCIADDPDNPDYDPDGDADGDGYTNADENAVGTDPCSASSTPPDFDDDGNPNSLDPDDDSDGLDDTEDPFAIDPNDGTTTTAPIQYSFQQSSQPGTILELGFTGLMTNGQDDYQDLYNESNVIAGAAAPVLTVEDVPPGDAYQTPNDQQYAFQSGVNVTDEPLTVHTTLEAPFSSTPEDFQSQGVYIGTGDQSNYIKLVTSAKGGTGGIQFAKETGDSFNDLNNPDVPEVVGSKTVDLYIDVYPGNDTATARYEITGNNIDGTISGELGSTSIPSSWLDNPDQGLAFGVISTSNGAGTFDTDNPYTATYTQLEVTEQGQTDNADPTASFTASPTGPTTGEQVTFDAAGSNDSDGSIASYEWDFDGDGQTDATGQTATTTFDSASDYDVSLTVTDDVGATDSATQTVSVEEPATGDDLVLAVNAGGGEYTATDGTTFVADTNFDGGQTFTSGDAGTPSEPDIENTDDDQLYWTERYGNFGYDIPVPEDGQYEVTLYFAELYQGVANDGGEGDRVFNVSAEDEVVLDSYDIVAESGAPQTAINETAVIEVTDGTLNLEFTPIEDNAKISAIEVEQVDDASTNTPPSIEPIDNQTITEGNSTTVPVSAADADGDSVSLSLSESPDFTELSDGEISIDPQSGDTADSPYTVEVAADDGTDTTTESFQVTVEEATAGPASAEVAITPGSGLEASTYGGGSFQVTNTGEQEVESVTIDLSTTTLPDMVFDPDGTAGDQAAKGLNIDSESGDGVGVVSVADEDVFSQPHNGQNGSDGYDVLTIEFTDFEPGETVTFSADNDPTSIKGATIPSQEAGPVSGLELAGATVEVGYADGTTQTTQTIGDGTDGGAEAVVDGDVPSAPSIGAEGVSLDENALDSYHSAATVTEGSQTITVSGPANADVTLVQVEGELELDNVPDYNGTPGYDVEGYESNKAENVAYYSATLGSNGEATIPVTLTDSTDVGGLNYFVAAVEDGDGAGLASDVVVLELTENTAPTIDAITDQGVTEGESVTVDVPASDADGDNLTYSVQGPNFVSVADNGTLTIVPGADAVGTYEVTVTASDGSATASESFAVYVDEPDQDGTVVAAVNAGGDAYTAADGTEYAASANSDVFTGGGTYGPGSPDIANTEDDTLYQSELYGGGSGGAPDAPNVTVSVPENGTYEVTLQFAEIFQGVASSDSPDSTTPPTDSTNENDRLFSVTVEGEEVLTDYDIFSEVGPLTATEKTYTVEVTDGTLNVDFAVTNDNAKISAITVESLDEPDDGPGPVGDFENAPTDPDGDGVYEDVNGDGEVNVGDVQALFANDDGPVVQNNTAAFDVNGDGEVNVGDVQALFAETSDGGA